jgi:hypothetical protein
MRVLLIVAFLIFCTLGNVNHGSHTNGLLHSSFDTKGKLLGCFALGERMN